MYIYYCFLFLFFFQKPLLFNSQKINKEDQNVSIQLINPLAYYRIDSLYNGYSLTIEEKEVVFKDQKEGDSQNFIFKNIDSNT